MIKTELDAKGEVLQSQLLNTQTGQKHYVSMRVTKEPEADVWMPRQVHGTSIVVLDEDRLSRGTTVEADAVITRMVGQWIGVRTADCVPVLLYDSVARVVAAVHAGWRGTVAHILRQVIEQMVKDMGCHTENILAAVGPSISPEAFEVGEEVADEFRKSGRGNCVLRRIWGPRGEMLLLKPHVDLWQSNVMDMLEMGMELQNIDCTPWCTYEHWQQLFSARREGIGTGRIVSAICLI